MGTLIRLLLRYSGYDVQVPAYLSVVSKTIEAMPSRKSRKWLFGGFLHLAPVLVGLYLLLVVRKFSITHGTREVTALLIAASWAWVGPCLIWYYERYTLPVFHKYCRRLLKNGQQYQEIKNAIYSNITSMPNYRAIAWTWRIIVIISFIWSIDYVKRFGIHGFVDWLWYFCLSVLFCTRITHRWDFASRTRRNTSHVF